MILCHSEPEGWLVRYVYQGMQTRSLFLDKARADAYSVNWHGTIEAVHCPVAVQPKVALQFEKTPEAPWEGETHVEDM